MSNKSPMNSAHTNIRYGKRFFLFFALYFILASEIFPQTVSQTDSLDYLFPQGKKNALKLESGKHINTINFFGDLFYKKSFSDFSLALAAQATAAYFTTSQQSFRTSQRVKLAGEYFVANHLSIGFLVNRNYFNDDKRLSISNAEVNHGMLYASFGYDKLKLNLFGGLASNIQAGRKDNGTVYGFEGFVNRFSFENQVVDGKFHFSNEDISPRKNYSRRADFSFASFVSPSFTNKISASFGEERRDFYTTIEERLGEHFNTDNNIERRTEKNIFAEEKMMFDFSNNFSLNISGSVASQQISREKKYVLPELVSVSTFDPRTERFMLDFTSSIFYKLPRFKLYAKINYYEKEESFSAVPINGASEILFELRQNQEARKNNSSKLAHLSAGCSYEFSPYNKINISVFHRKLKYDTPSEENFDDRDELLTMGRFRFVHRFSYLFRMNFDVEGSLNHMVYLFAERSANNNIKRILKLATEGIYEGKNVISKNRAEISANYTVYDFEDILQNFQSFAFRQALFRDSTSVNFNRKFGFTFYGYVKISEQGEFDWEKFSEKPFQFRREIFAEPVFFSAVGFFNFGLGARLFFLDISDFNESELLPANSYSSVGPSFLITTILSGELNLRFHGWYEFIKSEKNYRNENLNFNLAFLWKI